MVEYWDVTVIRSLKVSHKVGELLTFAIPVGVIRSSAWPNADGLAPIDSTSWSKDWKGVAAEPSVLFLRRSEGEETKLMPDLKLTGGSGFQGMYVLPVEPISSKEFCSCFGNLPEEVPKYNALPKTNQNPVNFRFLKDPLITQ
jgi:hypothetical protein